jgi:hypothetical protein
MKVLALDVSKRATGWAFGPVGSKPESGELRFAPPSSSDDVVWFEAFKWANEQMTSREPDLVAIEAAIPTTNMSDDDGNPVTDAKTHDVLVGLQAAIRIVVMGRLGRPAKIIYASSARKLFVGRGTFPKGEAKPAVFRRAIEIGWLTYQDATEARADAMCIWAKACADIDPSIASNLTPLFTAAPPPQDVEF